MRLPIAAFVFSATALLAPLCAAQEGFITLKDGSEVHGQLLSIDDLQVTGVVHPDGEERTYKREELTPGSWYMVRSRTVGDDARGRLELARFCVEKGLFGNAKAELEQVWDLDESLRDPAKELWQRANEGGATSLLQIAENALKRRQFANAKRLASLILTEYQDTAAAQRAAEILDELHTNEEATPSMQQQVHQPLTEAQVDKMRETDPRAVEARKFLERARERNLKGLKEKSLSAAVAQYEGSVADFRKVLEIADRVLLEEKDEPVIVERVTKLKGTITDEMVEAYINWAGVLATRGSYPNAGEVIDQCLTVVPDSTRAKKYREHIQLLAAVASSEKWRSYR